MQNVKMKEGNYIFLSVTKEGRIKRQFKGKCLKSTKH